MENNCPNYYAIIPARVRYDKDLTANAKLLYAEITALCNEKGFCTANNVYFAKLYQTNIRSVQRWLSSLVDNNYIAIENVFKKKTEQVISRKIFICQPHDKIVAPHDKNVVPMSNNIYINNTKNITSKNSIRENYKRETYKDIELLAVLSHFNSIAIRFQKQNSITLDDLKKIDCKVFDFELLEKSIEKSAYLKKIVFDCRFYLVNYKKIICDYYADFNTSTIHKQSKVIQTREYTQSELDAVFSDLDDLLGGAL